jgi:3-deoxy-manno-octulosonate cytidylyltransferase (CMP-KDO synthetase)
MWERCKLALPANDIYNATDHQPIAHHCDALGTQYVITSPDCLTGTDQVREAAEYIDADIYLNVQGDEPLINPDDIISVMNAAKRSPNIVINAMCKIDDEAEFYSPMIPNVVAARDGSLLYMSRAPVPSNKDHSFQGGMRQVCIMALGKTALQAFSSVREKTPVEAIEDLEVLRCLELGFDEKMIEIASQSIAVDTPKDVAKVEAILDGLEKDG